MDEAHYCSEAFSPITGRTGNRAGWPAVTLSNENALSRFRASPHPCPPPSGLQRAAHGPARASQGGCLPGQAPLVAWMLLALVGLLAANRHRA
jgi:hypothetical protein